MALPVRVSLSLLASAYAVAPPVAVPPPVLPAVQTSPGVVSQLAGGAPALASGLVAPGLQQPIVAPRVDAATAGLALKESLENDGLQHLFHDDASQPTSVSAGSLTEQVMEQASAAQGSAPTVPMNERVLCLGELLLSMASVAFGLWWSRQPKLTTKNVLAAGTEMSSSVRWADQPKFSVAAFAGASITEETKTASAVVRQAKEPKEKGEEGAEEKKEPFDVFKPDTYGNITMDDVKRYGTGGTIAYVITELVFWAVAVPTECAIFYQTSGRWPDFDNDVDKAAVLGFVFAASNVARLCLPLRFGAALALAPWINENVVSKFQGEKSAEATEP